MNIDKRYVVLRERRSDGFVEFDFAIGTPDIFAELVLNQSAFDEFCRENKVIFLDKDEVDSAESDQQEWRLSETSGKQFREQSS